MDRKYNKRELNRQNGKMWQQKRNKENKITQQLESLQAGQENHVHVDGIGRFRVDVNEQDTSKYI